jgi:hypothetical protein
VKASFRVVDCQCDLMRELFGMIEVKALGTNSRSNGKGVWMTFFGHTQKMNRGGVNGQIK